jgi:hypothetical protein
MTRLGHLRGRFDSALLVPIAGAGLLVLAVPSGRLVFVVAGIVGLACLVAGFFRPGATLALLFVAVLLVEQEFLAGAFAGQRRFYEPVISKLTLPDLLLACIAAGVLATRRRNVGSGSLAVPSAVLLLATFGACVTGLFADANHPELLRQARPIAYLCVVPIIVAHVWDREILLKRALDVFMAIVLLKAVQAILTAVTGIGLTGLRASGGVLVVQTSPPRCCSSSR